MLAPLSRFAFLVAVASPTCCQAGETLCTSGETVYFSCQVERTGRLLSLCGNELSAPEHFWLQYRFGLPEKLELVFPKTKRLFGRSGVEVGFYRRANGFDTDVSFKSGGWSYTVFHWAPGEGETDYKAGVFVARNRAGPGTTINCAMKPDLGHDGAFRSLAEVYGKE